MVIALLHTTGHASDGQQLPDPAQVSEKPAPRSGKRRPAVGRHRRVISARVWSLDGADTQAALSQRRIQTGSLGAETARRS